jgi:hypothetical protein
MLPTEYALTNGRVFLNDGLHDGLAVHVRDERIVAVCETAAVPSHVTQIDVMRRAIVPGLIDVHVHSEEWHAPLFLANGVTTVRDVGCELNTILDRRARWNQSDALAPRVVCCGPLLDGGGAAHKATMLVVKTPDEGRDAVDMLVESGVDQIKLYAWTEWPTFKAILEQSQKYHKFTVAHMMNYVNAQQAVEAGLNELEHCSGCAEAMYPARGLSGELWRKIFPDQTRDQINRLIDVLLEHGTWMAVTRIVWHTIAHEWDPRPWDNPNLRYAPRPLLAWWRTRQPHEFSREYWYDWARAEGAMQIFIAHLIERGVKIIAGSDAPFVHVLPGFGLHEELQLLLDCGMMPMQAIHAATSLAAQAIQLDQHVGTIEASKYADMLIVDGDPTQDIRALQKIWRVVRGGMMLDPAPLLARAEQHALTAQPNVVKRFSELY